MAMALSVAREQNTLIRGGVVHVPRAAPMAMALSVAREQNTLIRGGVVHVPRAAPMAMALSVANPHACTATHPKSPP